MSAHAFFSHITAAQIWGFPLPMWVDFAELHVCVIKPARAPRLSGVVGHHCAAGAVSVVERRGLRVTSAVDTWCMLSSVLPLDDLVAAGDWLVRRQQPFATIDALEAAVEAFAGRPGARRLKLAMSLVRARTDSPRKTRLRLLLSRAGLPEPVVNHPICDERGRFVAFGDLAYPRYRVLVEYDGAHHREDEQQFNRDVDRLDDIMQLEWRVVRLNKSHSHSQMVQKVTAALISRGWRRPRGGARRG
jgi:hypothetical protein